MYVGPSGSMWQFLGFSGLNSGNSLFYSVLRRPTMFEMAHHKPTKCLFLQYLQLVPAKFLVDNASPNCELHFTLFFWEFSGSQKCHIIPEGTNHTHIHTYIHIYIYINIYKYVCVLWSYYLGQVWLLLSGPRGRYYLGQVLIQAMFCTLSYHFVFWGGPNIRQFSKNGIFVLQKLSNFPVLSLNFEKSHFTLLNHCKHRGFSKLFVVQRKESAPKNDLGFLVWGLVGLKMRAFWAKWPKRVFLTKTK